MLVAVLALVVVAATAAVVIRDAHPRPPKAIPAVPDAAVDAAPEPERADYPTQAVDMTQLGAMDESGLDAPTQSMTMPVAFAGGQAAAVLPYPSAPQPVPAAEPAAQPATFVPAGVPHLQPDPERLIQTEIVIEDPEREHSAAVTKLVLGVAVSGTAMGLVVVGAGRGIASLFHVFLG